MFLDIYLQRIMVYECMIFLKLTTIILILNWHRLIGEECFIPMLILMICGVFHQRVKNDIDEFVLFKRMCKSNKFHLFIYIRNCATKK